MDRNKKVPLRAALCVLAISTSPIASAAQLMNAREVLTQIEVAPGATNATQSSTAARLLEDIVRFRTQSASMTPKQAASAWFDLYERADTPDRESWRSDHRAYDVATHAAVGPHSVLAALPPPTTWSALNAEARTRARRAPRDLKALATRLMTELLMQDRRASSATLKEIQALADRLPPEERDALRANLAELRWTLAELYGTPEEIAAAFIERLETRGSGPVNNPVDVPDLVELLGEPRAAELLQNAFTRPVRLQVKRGDATRALARRVALEQVDTMREPQWALVNGIVDGELYEAMQRRFPAAASNEGAAQNRFDSYKAQADTWYFLSLVSAGRQDDAEKMLGVIAGNEPLTLARPAIDALQLFGHNEALYNFLHALLAKRPELRVWNTYLEQAAFTGHSADALKLINSLLKRKDLPDYVLTELRYHRANALLADDQVNPAINALRQLLGSPPKREDKTLSTRADAAVRLAAVGRILNRRDVPAAGLTFAKQVLELSGDDESQAFYREGLLRSVFAEQRKLALPDQAQAVAVAEIRRSASIVDEYQQYGFAPPTQITAMAELVSIYVSQKRYQDAVTLVEESTKWGARDLATLLHVKDSQDVPLGVLVARALAAGGNVEAALSVTRATIDAHPGNDAAYEVLLEINANAAPYLDELYAQDAFEERPLIWKAIALLRAGQYEPAQQTIVRAIAVDPSDGEQGPNHRMRAYQVLADILDAKGDRKSAAVHRNTMDAIRISERADDLYQLGLYKRAFAGYREALDHFADAYCIQSRLAVQLNQQGRRKEALDHYRRAYELMPAAFGRMESHCFGCENVFQGPEQQSIADRAFQEILARNPQQAQAHYLLGYLRETQGRHAEALQLYRQAVSLDSEYLNAWKHLHDLGERIHIDPKERDIARLKLMALDPRQRYVTFDLTEVTDLAGLWRAAAAVQSAAKPKLAGPSLYPLRRSAQVQDESIAKLPEGQRGQFQMWYAAFTQELNVTAPLTPQQTLMRHELIKVAARLMGAEPNRVQH